MDKLNKQLIIILIGFLLVSLAIYLKKPPPEQKIISLDYPEQKIVSLDLEDRAGSPPSRYLAKRRKVRRFNKGAAL